MITNARHEDRYVPCLAVQKNGIFQRYTPHRKSENERKYFNDKPKGTLITN